MSILPLLRRVQERSQADLILKDEEMKQKNTLSAKREEQNSLYKAIVCAMALCIIMAIMLAIYNATVPDILAGFDEKGNMEHTAWFVRYAAYIPPVIVIAVILTCFYSSKET